MLTNSLADAHMEEGNRGIENSCFNTALDKPKARCTLNGITLYTQGFNREKRNRNDVFFFSPIKQKEKKVGKFQLEKKFNTMSYVELDSIHMLSIFLVK